MKRIFLFSLILLQLAFSEKAPTAFDALKSAENHIAKESVGKVIQIIGKRDEKTLTPSTWSFVFLDLNARQQGRIVTIRAGKPIEIRDGYFELDKMRLAAYKDNEVISPSSLKVDSNQALQAIIKSGSLEKIKLSTVTFDLSRDNNARLPYWTVRLFADKDGKEEDIGYGVVSSETGGVVELKLELQRLVDKKKK
ncbi:MAG: hypothetical protein V4507_17060 [Verrucomicrobiota bacterium]